MKQFSLLVMIIFQISALQVIAFHTQGR